MLRKCQNDKPIHKPRDVHFVDIDPRNDAPENSLTPVEDLKKVRIGPKPYQTTQIVTTL